MCKEIKSGYTLKSISNLTPHNIVNLSGIAPHFSLIVKKTGSCTATIILQHPTKEDARIPNCEFQIYSDLLQVSNDGKVTLKSGVDKTTITNVFYT